jgi:hypothetical protein
MSENNVSENRLNDEIREIIGNETIDSYPWEFSYIAANQFNWIPRKAFGTSLSRWISEKENYLLKKEDSPQFVLFHEVNDMHGGKLGSIDYRYILNDEPSVIFNLLNNYTLLEKNDKYLLFKRDTVSHFEDVYLDEFQNYRFGEWIDVPYDANEITRLKVFSSNTLLGRVNKFFYKETEYFIDYQFENDIILTYRYISGTAVDGLWCNPFIRLPNTKDIESKIVKIRLRNANPYVVRETFKAQFQHIKLNFHKPVTPSKEIFLNVVQQSDNEFSKLNGFSNQVESNGYSYCYKINLDSLFRSVEADSLIVEANILASNSAHAGLVIATEGAQEDFYAVAYIPNGISNKSHYYSYLNRLINSNQHSSGIMKVYVYNFGNSPIYIDDFRVCVKNGKQ